jgi:hypothetical protein
LLKLNEDFKQATNPKSFAEAIQKLQEDLDPDSNEGLNAAIHLVNQLAIYHFDTLDNADEIGLSSYQKEIWATDYKALKKALGLLRSVTQD